MRNRLTLVLTLAVMAFMARSGPQAQEVAQKRHLATFELNRFKVANAFIEVSSWTFGKGGHTAINAGLAPTGNYIRDHRGGSRSITRLMSNGDPSGSAGAIRSKSVTRRFNQSLVIDFDWQGPVVLHSQKGPPRVLAMTGLDDGTISR